MPVRAAFHSQIGEMGAEVLGTRRKLIQEFESCQGTAGKGDSSQHPQKEPVNPLNEVHRFPNSDISVNAGQTDCR